MLHTDPNKRHEFVLLFDAKNSNPNGDPDAGNMPRVDPETMHGLVTDVAIKRKIRNYIQITRENQPRMDIFIQSMTALNTLKEKAAEKVNPPLTKEERKGKKPILRLQKVLCEEYYDIRMFGAVLSTSDDKDDRLNAGQVRGPVQLTFARSIDPVLPLDIAITRQARTTEKRMETGTTEMGRKPLIPYGLYRAHGYFNPYLAEQTGVTVEDLEILWEALQNLFEFDRSAARGEMNVRGLWVFTHENRKGNAHAHELFELVTVRKRDGVTTPRSYDDYEVHVDRSRLPAGVTLTALIESR